MTLLYDELGYLFEVINYDFDGNEINAGTIDPLDISHVRCTYIPTFAKSVTYKPSISARVTQTATPRIVVHTPTIQRTVTP